MSSCELYELRLLLERCYLEEIVAAWEKPFVLREQAARMQEYIEEHSNGS